MMPPYDAVVLAGGAARRMGGADKAMLDVDGRRLLDRAVAAVAGAQRVVVVGPPRAAEPASEFATTVVWTSEDPPGGGPAAAIVHALAHVAAPTVVVLAVDAPFAASAIERLLGALPGHEAAMLVDGSGRRQSLVAAYATAALRANASGESWTGRAVRDLVAGFSVAEVAASGEEALDCDTAEDLARARRLALRPAHAQGDEPPERGAGAPINPGSRGTPSS